MPKKKVVKAVQKEQFTEKIEPIQLVDEMKTSYLDYAMSVIVSRALPDVRDGLKPVHRRILYAMWSIGLKHNAKFRKSAHVIGEVMAKYHPHGDAAIYDSMVRMAQNFAMRTPLVRGQGNFGSLDGDPPAAMRYCVSGDTLLLTNRGILPIKEVSTGKDTKINLEVLNYQGRKKKAVRFFNSGKHSTIELKTKEGYGIKGTKNHPLLVWRLNELGHLDIGWKLLEDIKIGDYLILNRNKSLFAETNLNLKTYWPKLGNKRKNISLPTEMNSELAFLLGALVSEGSYHQKQILFNNSDITFYNKVKKAITNQFPEVSLYERNIKGNCKELSLYHQQAVRFLENIGFDLVRSDRKKIPFSVLKSDKKSVKSFLQALFEGDGSVIFKTDKRHGGNSIELAYHSKSTILISQLKTLLLNFGIVTTAPYQDKRNDCYKLVISGVENIKLFNEKINFFSQRKRKVLSKIKGVNPNRLSHSDYIPLLSKYLRSQYSSSALKKYNLDRYNSIKKHRDKLERLLSVPDLKTINWLLKNNFFFNEVKDIKKSTKKETVYSIKVDSACHSFVANGLINHNTEAKLEAAAEEMLIDIEKNTVDFSANYDGSTREPNVLPSRLPGLLLNGSMGIAVGMATNIPPHNLGELCDGVSALIDNPKSTVEELTQFIQGPDFPTGGIIYNKKDIATAYATGRGGIVVRAQTEIQERKDGRFQIIVTEIPYQVNKSSLVEKIAGLVHEKKLEGIRDLRDESNKEGVRIVIDLKKDSYPKKILNSLFKMTDLQTTFHVNTLALVDNLQPRVLNLKTILEEYIKHRQEVIRRRTEFDLAKAKERAHILEGLKKALDKIDQVISTIKKSKDKDAAKENLMKKFKFTERQSLAILEMRLQQLANLERKKIEDELKEKKALIKELELILNSSKKILNIIKKDVRELKEKYSNERRTKIIAHGIKDFSIEDLIPNEPTIIMATRDGYIKRLPPSTFKTQSRGGKGIIGLTTKEEDVVEQMITTNTHDNILFFTTRGRVFQLRAYDIPETKRTSKGQAMVNFLQLAPNEKVSSILSMQDVNKYKFLVMVTSKGNAKRTALEDFKNVRRSGLIALKLKPEDMLEWVRPSTGKDEIIISTANGQAIRFKESGVRAMGRAASGVRGIKLKEKDEVVGMDVVCPDLVKKKILELLVVSENGLGKKTKLSEYKVQGRGGSGIKTMAVTKKTGKIISMKTINSTEERDLVMISVNGQVIRTPLKSVSTLGRATQGVRVMRFKAEGDKVASITLL